MGFSDEQFEKVAGKLSNAQLYKQAGNSICVSCLKAIFSALLKGNFSRAGKRPRLSLLDLVKEKEYKPFYIYCFEK